MPEPKGSEREPMNCCFCGAESPYHLRSCPYLGGVSPEPPTSCAVDDKKEK